MRRLLLSKVLRTVSVSFKNSNCCSPLTSYPAKSASSDMFANQPAQLRPQAETYYVDRAYRHPYLRDQPVNELGEELAHWDNDEAGHQRELGPVHRYHVHILHLQVCWNNKVRAFISMLEGYVKYSFILL